MFDRNTLVITYDTKRGEPRGARKKGADPRALGLGDCVDCNICVQACPTGIDIRKGLQYECIACAACIDACDGVMHKLGYAPKLIKYTTQNAQDGKRTRVVRPRVVIYGSLLAALFTGAAVSLALRKPVALDVIHDRNALYRVLEEDDAAGGDDERRDEERHAGKAENVYTLKVMNKSERAQRFRVSVSGPGKLRIDPATEYVSVGAGEVASVPLRVRRDAWEVLGASDIRVRVAAVDNPALQAESRARFFAPTR